ncbi:MAG: hypothetical protein WCA46_15485 [Actinocatenispora sp.]
MAEARTGSARSGQAAESVDSADRPRGHVVKPGHLPVSEMLFDRPGAASPFGEDITFPLPVDQIVYQLPDGNDESGEADRHA